MHSHHSHSGQYCTHATGDLEECIEVAIRQNFEVFSLTEHIPRYRDEDLYPGEKQSLSELMDMFSDYHAHARRLQVKYRDVIRIHVGLESEYIRDEDIEKLKLLIAKYPIDFMVGSVHHVNGHPIDFDKETWNKALDSCGGDEEEFYGQYFNHQYRILETFQPLVVGHFDVILLFAAPDTNLLAYDSVTDKIRRNIDLVVSYGGMFELNSAAFRKGWTTAYPKPNIVRTIKAAGAVFCLSDDSHGPAQVGLNFHRMQEYIQEMGIDRLGSLYVPESTSIDGQKVKVSVRADAETLQKFLAWTPN